MTAVSIHCAKCRKKVLLPVKRAFRGSLVECSHCGEKFPLSGLLLAEVFWAVNQR